MIVEIDPYYMSFLELDESDWYDKTIFMQNIAHISNMTFQVGDKKFDFTLDNKASYMYYETSDGAMKTVDLTKGKLSQSADGSYTYTDENGTAHKVRVFDLSQGDYYFRIFDSTGTVAYEPFQKFLFTTDRNNLVTLRVYSNVGTDKETYRDYAFTEIVDARFGKSFPTI
jgi:hypothetical protein